MIYVLCLLFRVQCQFKSLALPFTFAVMEIPKKILPIIVIAQFCCTTLWFGNNAVMQELCDNFNLADTALGHLTSAVQFGFISGTLTFALFTIADRFSPSKIFTLCAGLGALINLTTLLQGNGILSLWLIRFATGFFLAGIYPIGMKIAADYFGKSLGKSLGYLVGALVLGTAFPHLLKGLELAFSWKQVLITTSVLAALGGALIFTIQDGPFRVKGKKLSLQSFFQIFRNRPFRSAAFGYFGHMWELYSFWAFLPLFIASYLSQDGMQLNEEIINVSMLSFFIIAIGGIGCVLAGYLSQRLGTKRIASWALAASGICCLLSPFFYFQTNLNIFLLFLLFWGFTVVADSPLFSTLVAQNAKAEWKGTALTIVNCIGFFITILSIQLLTLIFLSSEASYLFLILAIGPLLGVMSIRWGGKVLEL